MIRFILILSLVCPLQMLAQHSDVIEFGLKGKVKKVTVYQYELIQENENGKWIAADEEKYWSKATRYFDLHQGIDSFRLVHNYNHIKKPYNKVEFFLSTYQSSNKGRRESGVQKIMGFSSTLTFNFSYSWINEREYIERGISEDSSITEITYLLSKESRDSLTITKGYLKDSLIQSTVQTKYYDEKGDLIKMVKTNQLSDQTSTSIYRSVEYDLKGNPTVVYVYKENANKPKSVVYRNFEYYE